MGRLDGGGRDLMADNEVIPTKHGDITRQVEQFLYHEADLLDTRKFDVWLELFAEDAVYEVRALGTVAIGNRTMQAPEPEVKVLTRERRDFLETRVIRLMRGLAACEFPASLTRRFITNVRAVMLDDNRLSVKSNIAIFQSRASEDWLVGSRDDILSMDDGAFRVVHRCATMDYEVLPRTLTIFL